jgi:uncharacterized membrane protein
VAYNVRMRKLLPAALTASAVIWLALLLLAPTFPREAALLYESASRICHQKPERSFHLSGVQLPVCARCFGLYASGAAGAIGAWLLGRSYGTPNPGEARLLFAAAIPTVATVGVEWIGLAQPSNLGRMMASVPLGAAAGWVFVGMLLVEAQDTRPLEAAGLDGKT